VTKDTVEAKEENVEKENINSYVALGTIFRISVRSVFKEASRNFEIIFLFHKAN
jgi:hypothetical protein